MKKQENFEGSVLVILSLMLASVFFFSVYMYDDIATNVNEGVLCYAAESVREFIDTNEVVAAFLGIEEEPVEKTDIASEAAAYIARYNEIYEDFK